MNKPSLAYIVLTFILIVPAFAQKASQVYQGDDFFSKQDYQNALKAYFLALHDNPEDATILYKIGNTFLQTETKGMAASFLEKAYKIDPTIDRDIVYQLGVAYQCNLQYAKAKYVFEQYKKFASKKLLPELDQRIKQCILSHFLVSFPKDILIENAGTKINSIHDDYSPILSADGLTMIFTSNRTNDTLKTHQGFEDIYIAKNENDEWTIPQKIGYGINMGHHDAAASLSPDGKTLFLYYDAHNGDVFTSKLNEDGSWGKPSPLNSNINTATFKESCASVSADGKQLFFTSTKAGGKGNMDIYMSTLDEKGGWGKAVNLGDVINTVGNEDSPYIHPDGVTLYFSSDGHPGMGSADIFKSTFKDGQWQKPENLGYPLNSIEYDGFFTISEDKRTGYFATLRKYGVGGYDILKVTFRDAKPVEPAAVIAKAEPVKETVKDLVKEDVKAPVSEKTEKKTEIASAPLVIQGKAFDKKTSHPLTVNISLVDVKTKKQVGSVQSNATTGSYEFKVAQNGIYVVTAECNGYLFNSLNVQVSSTSKNNNTDFSMMKADVGSVMVLRNILFETGKSDLKPSSIMELEKVRKLLLANPNLKVQINGHTDNVGDPVVNKTLSLKRALAVVNHLALNGIEFDRLSARGYGSEKPVASNDDEKDGREFNRRTEIEILDVNANKDKI